MLISESGYRYPHEGKKSGADCRECDGRTPCGEFNDVSQTQREVTHVHACDKESYRKGVHVDKASAYTVSIIIVFVPLLLRPHTDEAAQCLSWR